MQVVCIQISNKDVVQDAWELVQGQDVRAGENVGRVLADICIRDLLL